MKSLIIGLLTASSYISAQDIDTIAISTNSDDKLPSEPPQVKPMLISTAPDSKDIKGEPSKNDELSDNTVFEPVIQEPLQLEIASPP